MTLYRYVKSRPRRSSKMPSLVLGGFALVVGLGIIAYVTLPFIGFYASNPTEEIATAYPIPVDEIIAAHPGVLGASSQTTTHIPVTVATDSDGFSYFRTDFTPHESPVDSFVITIPKLDIFQAEVKVNSTDFDKNIGHFPGTALPGEVGNSFLTGHSVLPQFFSEKNYKSIFSNLPKLRFNDEFTIEYNGRKQTYAVEKTRIVEPETISVLNPPDAFGKYVTLMTCVPPGLNTKRLVITARLKSDQPI